MPKYRVSFSVWRMGNQSMFSYLETDKDYGASYNISYPITHQEAVELSMWATHRARTHTTEPLLDPFGWAVYMESLDVVQPDIPWKSHYVVNRRDPECFDEYRELSFGVHRLVDHSV